MTKAESITGGTPACTLRRITLPDFGIPAALPQIPRETYARRADSLLARAGTDWVVVYADREHVANMLHLTGIEPRFEEALLVLGRNGLRALVVGNETMDYAPLARLDGLDLHLCQSLSLMGQDRSVAPALAPVLWEIGLKPGQTVGLVGWKYLTPEEGAGFVLPHNILAAVREAVGGTDKLVEATPILMHPETGERAVVDADQIAVFEWAAARASAAVRRIVEGTGPGMTEFEAAGLMGYQGEPLSCHMMMASADETGRVVGLRSPTAKRLTAGSGVTTAVGYWGALSSRAGMLSGASAAPGFLDACHTYFNALVTWYKTARIGVTGGEIHDAVTAALAEGGLKPALNPGHLLGYDEWTHSAIRPGSTEKIRSGMAFQVDVIPGPLGKGQALNCEDAVVFADKELCGKLAELHPELYARVEARRAFVSDVIGLELAPEVLPLSNTPLWLPPEWSEPDRVLTLSPDLEN
ncbi:M24 family metallopeptidase [Pseudoruegeria sp. HB172150]|uniref:M24 family metallopeptidase n=1 Tax=Pseudoruegeria sp. HB172150 TaxID=2721164 RepID=UPI0015564847|nr:M24 family metallopeptidase [Pseudoruegeria sp. HB172150]